MRRKIYSSAINMIMALLFKIKFVDYRRYVQSQNLQVMIMFHDYVPPNTFVVL